MCWWLPARGEHGPSLHFSIQEGPSEGWFPIVLTRVPSIFDGYELIFRDIIKSRTYISFQGSSILVVEPEQCVQSTFDTPFDLVDDDGFHLFDLEPRGSSATKITHARVNPGSVKYLQIHLPKSSSFVTLILSMPRPPLSFGRVTMSHLTRCDPFWFPKSFKKKFLISLSMELQTATGALERERK